MQYGLKVFLLIWFLMIFIVPGFLCNKLLKIKLKKNNVKQIGSIYLINMGFALVLHYPLNQTVNIFYTISRLYHLDWSYQEVMKLSHWFNGCLLFSILLAIAINKIRKICSNQNLIFIQISVMIIVWFGGLAFSQQSKQMLVFNEVSSNNQTVYMDVYNSYCDYIELYNRGSLICEIDTLYISDDKENLKKIKLSGGRVRQGEFLVLGLDKEKSVYYIIEQEEQKRWYPPEELNQENMKKIFSISKMGEYIYLSDESGNILDSIYTQEQKEDTAICRVEDGKDVWEMRSCTPGETNAKAELLRKIEAPQLSHESGFYDEEFELSILCKENAKVYYTLDGSTPDENAILYQEAVRVYDKSQEENRWRNIPNVVIKWEGKEIEKTSPVDKVFVLKAIAIDEEGAKSPEVQATYLINKPEYEGKNIVSITAEPEELFGEHGIYVTGKEYDDWYLAGNVGSAEERPAANFENRGRASEIKAFVEYIGSSGSKIENLGLRIQGGGSRYEAVKRFAGVARKEYGGSKWLQNTWFEDVRTHAVNFRPGFANAVLQYLVADRNVTVQQAIPAEVFINGEHWYSGYIQERYNNSFLEEKYGLEEDSVCIVKEGRIDINDPNSNSYNEIYEYINKYDLTQEEAYEGFCDIVDIDSYIDFLCIYLYLGHMDWCENKNIMAWKSIPDGKWYWAMYDLDSIDPTVINQSQYYTGIDEWAQINPFHQKGEFVDHSLKEGRMYPALYKNPEFQKKMVLTFMDLMNSNFSVSNVKGILKEWGEDITWNDSFFIKRPDYMCRYIAEEFGLQGEKVSVVLEANEGGVVKINSIIPDLTDGSWEGCYYTDYPIEVTAIPEEGYRFVGWSGDMVSEEEKMQIDLKNPDTKLIVNFEKVEF